MYPFHTKFKQRSQRRLLLAGNMAHEIAMLGLDTDGAFAFCVFNLRDDAERGILREEAA